MVNNFININKANNHHSSPENTEHKKTLFADGDSGTGTQDRPKVWRFNPVGGIPTFPT